MIVCSHPNTNPCLIQKPHRPKGYKKHVRNETFYPVLFLKLPYLSWTSYLFLIILMWSQWSSVMQLYSFAPNLKTPISFILNIPHRLTKANLYLNKTWHRNINSSPVRWILKGKIALTPGCRYFTKMWSQIHFQEQFLCNHQINLRFYQYFLDGKGTHKTSNSGVPHVWDHPNIQENGPEQYRHTSLDRKIDPYYFLHKDRKSVV